MRRFAIDLPPGVDVDSDLALDTVARAKLPTDGARTESESHSLQASFQHSSATPQRLAGDSFGGNPSEDGARDVEVAVLPIALDTDAASISPLRQLLAASGEKSGSPSPARVRIRNVRVFCNFLTQEKGRKQSFNVRLRDQGIRGRDVVEATIKAFLSSDDRLVCKFSSNVNEYKLFIADEATGEEETRIQHESPCGNFTSMALVPHPGAYLSHFPQRAALLPPPAGDVTLNVEVRGSKVRQPLAFTPDMQVEKLERAIFSRLPIRDARGGSLRIRYGPLELAVSDRYNFGVGCGSSEVPVGERTLLLLHRYGVTEAVVEGTVTEEVADAASPVVSDNSMSLFRRMDEEEARAYQHFDVIKTNKYGVRQERVMGVDGDRIYNMRPSTEIGKTKNPERNIADIEHVKTFTDRPNYCEIEYKRSARFDTDKIEFKNALECSIFHEKLKVLRKLHERRAHLSQGDSAITRFFGKFGFGK